MTIEKTPAMRPYIQTHNALWLGCLDQQQHDRSNDYWYTITSGGCPHTAFRSRRDVLRWLSERGLHLLERLPEKGTGKHMRIEGTYHRASYLDVQAFVEISPLLKVAEMSNSRYTLAKVTEQDGVRTIHLLNPNVRERVEFPSDEIRWYEHWYQGCADAVEIEQHPDAARDGTLTGEEQNRLAEIRQMIEQAPDIFPDVVLRLLAETEHYHRGWENHYRMVAQRMKSLVAGMGDLLFSRATCECGPEEEHPCHVCRLLNAANQLDEQYPLP
jgi:hypothetical protein